MAGKTYFTDEMSIQGHFTSINDINTQIEDNIKDIENSKRKLFGIMTATPKDLFPNSENIMFDIETILTDEMEYISDKEIENFKLYNFKDYVEIEKIDLTEYNKNNYD